MEPSELHDHLKVSWWLGRTGARAGVPSHQLGMADIPLAGSHESVWMRAALNEEFRTHAWAQWERALGSISNVCHGCRLGSSSLSATCCLTGLCLAGPELVGAFLP